MNVGVTCMAYTVASGVTFHFQQFLKPVVDLAGLTCAVPGTTQAQCYQVHIEMSRFSMSKTKLENLLVNQNHIDNCSIMYMYYFGLNRYLNHIYSSVFSQEMSIML